MFGEYINMGLMLLIIGATFWILKSPKKGSAHSDNEDELRTDSTKKRDNDENSDRASMK